MRLQESGITLSLLSFWAVLHGCGGRDEFSTRAAHKETTERNQVDPKSEPGGGAETNASRAKGTADAHPPGALNSETQNPQRTEPDGPTDLSIEDIDPCTGTFANGKILILDFKSGWFAGDGGTFFSDSITPTCAGDAALDIDYLHITTELVETNRKVVSQQEYVLPCLGQEAARNWFHFDLTGAGPAAECTLGSLDTYGQIWVLSGDETDELDVPISSALFQSVLMRLQERSARGTMGLFLGAGLSNITHANSIAQSTLGHQNELFSRNIELSQGQFPSPDFVQSFKAAPLLGIAEGQPGPGQFSNVFYPFANVETIYDYGELNEATKLSVLLGQLPIDASRIYAEQPDCLGDPIVPSSLEVVARDACNNVIMAHGRSGTIKFFAEGNMARFYGLKDPLEHLSRLAHFLAAP